MAKSNRWKWFLFADGTLTYVRGFSRQEKAVEVARHGKIIASGYEGEGGH